MYSRRRKRIRTLGTPSLVREEKGPEVDQGGLEIRRPFSRETSGSNPSLRQRTLSPEAKLKTAS